MQSPCRSCTGLKTRTSNSLLVLFPDRQPLRQAYNAREQPFSPPRPRYLFEFHLEHQRVVSVRKTVSVVQSLSESACKALRLTYGHIRLRERLRCRGNARGNFGRRSTLAIGQIVRDKELELIALTHKLRFQVRVRPARKFFRFQARIAAGLPGEPQSSPRSLDLERKR